MRYPRAGLRAARRGMRRSALGRVCCPRSSRRQPRPMRHSCRAVESFHHAAVLAQDSSIGIPARTTLRIEDVTALQHRVVGAAIGERMHHRVKFVVRPGGAGPIPLHRELPAAKVLVDARGCKPVEPFDGLGQRVCEIGLQTQTAWEVIEAPESLLDGQSSNTSLLNQGSVSDIVVSIY